MSVENKFPFDEPLVPSEFPDIKTFKSDPTKLVKEYMAHPKNLEDLRDMVETFHSNQLTPLSERYGIRLAHTDIVAGKNENGELTVFFVRERIRGQSIKSAEVLPEEARKKLCVFYETIIQHHIDAYNENGKFWCDFKNDQLTYGKGSEDKEDEVYIVDTESYLLSYTTLSPDSAREMFYIQLIDVYDSVVDAEQKFDPPREFDSVRAKFKEIVETAPESAKKDEHFRLLRARLGR